MLNRLIRFSLVSAFALAIAGHGVAIADSHEGGDDKTEEKTTEGGDDAEKKDGDGEEKKEDGGGEEKKADDDAGSDDASATSRKSVTKENYPTSLTGRPLVNPKGMIELGGAISHVRLSVAGISADATGLGVSASYVPADKIQVGLSTGLGIDPDVEWSESLGLSAWYSVMEEGMAGKLDVAAGVSTGLNFQDGADVFSGFTVHGLTRYHLGPKMFVTAGSNLLEVQTADPSALSLNIDLGFTYQATPKIAATLTTRPAHIKLSGDANATTTYGDVIPLGIMGTMGMSAKLDVYAMLSFPSLEDAGDLMTIAVGARFRM